MQTDKLMLNLNESNFRIAPEKKGQSMRFLCMQYPVKLLHDGVDWHVKYKLNLANYFVNLI